MKKIRIFLTVFLFLTFIGFAQTLVAQTHHYTYAYSIMSDGREKVQVLPVYAKEYSITYSSNVNGFYFSTPNGSPLGSAFMLNTYDGINQIFSSNNNCSYVGTASLSQPIGQFKKYIVSIHRSGIYNGVVLNDENVNESIYVSNDGNTLVLGLGGYSQVYTRIATRSIPNHTSMANSAVSQGSQPTYNSNSSYNYNNTGGSITSTCSLCNGSGRCCGAGNVAYSNQYCGGSGKCHPCNGTGWMTNTVTGNKMKCTYCGGTGTCYLCRGTGKCARCGGTGKH